MRRSRSKAAGGRGGGRKKTLRISVVIIITLLFFAGSALGALAETRIDAGTRSGASAYIDSLLQAETRQGDGMGVFADSFRSNGILLLAMAVGGITVVLFPAALAVLLYKGAAIGFTSAVILEGSPGTGVLRCCAALLPQNLIFIPLLAIYAYFTICSAMDIIRCRNQRFRGRIYGDSMKVYLLVSVAGAVLLCLGAGIEAFLNPVLLRLM